MNPDLLASSLNRRRLLGGGLAAGLLAAQAPAWAQQPTPFALGVASGEPWPDGFVIWTRLTKEPLAPDGLGGMDGPVEVRWQVAEDEGMRRIVRSGRTRADRALAHSVHVELAGLKPGRDYFYRFTALGEQSRIGRARTAPAPGAPLQSLRLAAASCAHYETGYFSAYRHMAAENPDLVLFLGDYIYEYSYTGERAKGRPRRHDQAEDVADLAGYRRRYALHHADGDLQTLHAAAPCLATWDDHEVQNDYSGTWSQDTRIPPEAFERRRRAAYQAFYEHMPLRRRSIPTPTNLRLYDRYRFGDLVELTMLDERQYRTQQPCPLPDSRRGHVAPLSCPDLEAGDRTMLGFEQERWLYEGFRNPKARWNVVAQQLLVAPLDQLTPDGAWGRHTEGWSGYGANRRRMIAAMDLARLKNAVFLGGDMHTFMTTDLRADDRDPASRIVAAEFVGTSITSDAPNAALGKAMQFNPHVRFYEPSYRGYMAAEVRPDRLEMSYRAISDRVDPNATVSTIKRYVVEDGKAGAVEA